MVDGPVKETSFFLEAAIGQEKYHLPPQEDSFGLIAASNYIS